MTILRMVNNKVVDSKAHRQKENISLFLKQYIYINITSLPMF